MKILYVITSTDVGGAEKALVSLVQEVAPRHQVQVVCLKPLGALAAELKAAGADVTSLQMTGAGLGTVAKLVREINAFQPDVVHAMLFRAIEFARLACAGRNVKLITTPHFDLSKKSCAARWLDRALKNVDTRSCAESVSTYQFLLEEQHYSSAKTVLVRNSVKKSLFFKDNFVKSRMRAEKKFLDIDVLYICVARLAKIKNPQALLQAFGAIVPHCPHAKLIYVGDGEERNALEKMVQAQNLTNKVFIVGEQQNINEWLNMADVFVLLSKEESLPLALLEAQQVGLPCIVGRVGDMPKRVTHGEDGFVCNPKDTMLVSCLLTELYENEELRRKMGKKALRKSAQEPDSSAQYQQLYQQVVQI